MQKSVRATGVTAAAGLRGYCRASGSGVFCAATQASPKDSVIFLSLETLTRMPVSRRSASAPSRNEPHSAPQRSAASRAAAVALPLIPNAARRADGRFGT